MESSPRGRIVRKGTRDGARGPPGRNGRRV